MTPLSPLNPLSGYLLKSETFNFNETINWTMRHPITQLRRKEILEETIRERFIERVDERISFLLSGRLIYAFLTKR